MLAQRRRRVDARERQLGAADDDAEHVVEVVRHAAREAAHRLHLLRLLQLVRELGLRLLGVLAGRDIDQHRQQAPLAVQLHQAARQLEHADLAVAAPELDGVLIDLAVLAQELHQLVALRRARVGPELHRRAPDGLFARVAVQAQRRLVDVEDRAVGDLAHDDADRAAADDRREPAVGLSKLRLGRLALGHVLGGGEDPAALRGLDDVAPVPADDGPAALAAQVELDVRAHAPGLKGVEHPRALLGADPAELDRRPADRLVAAELREATEGVVDLEVPAGREIADRHQERAVVERGDEQRLAVVQLLVRALALVDVVEHREDLVSDDDAVDLRRLDRAALARDPVLRALDLAARGDRPVDEAHPSLGHLRAVRLVGVREEPPVVHRGDVVERVAEGLDGSPVDALDGAVHRDDGHRRRDELEDGAQLQRARARGLVGRRRGHAPLELGHARQQLVVGGPGPGRVVPVHPSPALTPWS